MGGLEWAWLPTNLIPPPQSLDFLRKAMLLEKALLLKCRPIRLTVKKEAIICS